MSRLNIEESCRFQYVVLWVASGVNEEGEVTVDSPIEIRVRWEDRIDEIQGPKGTPIATDGTIVADRLIPMGSILWQGRLSSLPDPVTNLKRIIAEKVAPDLKNRFTRKELIFTKHSDTLPSLTS